MQMQQLYPGKWAKDNGEKPDNNSLWVGALDTLTTEAMERGVRQLANDGWMDSSGHTVKEWPPNIPTFIGICRRTQAQAAAQDSEPLQIDNLPCDTDQAKDWIAFMIVHGILPRHQRMTRAEAVGRMKRDPKRAAEMLAAHERETVKLRGRVGL